VAKQFGNAILESIDGGVEKALLVAHFGFRNCAAHAG
jgi:hypothetical protein